MTTVDGLANERQFNSESMSLSNPHERIANDANPHRLHMDKPRVS
jgi:hypothetical protein